MRVSKSQCSIFKEFYRAFLQDEVDKETKTWMAEHKDQCNYCREWAKSIEENREDKVNFTTVQKDIFADVRNVIKRRIKILHNSTE